MPASRTTTARLHPVPVKSNMASRFQFEYEMPNTILTEEDLVDDSMGVVPINGLQTPQSLEKRLIARLEYLLKSKVGLEEDVAQRSVVFTLTPDTKSGLRRREGQDKTGVLIIGLQKALGHIAKGSNRERACAQLRDEVLLFTYENSKNIIEGLNMTFQNNKPSYDDLVTRVFGINDIDDASSTIDSELADRLIDLYHKASAYNKSMKETNMLIELASQMARVIMHLQDRLRGLLCKASFSGEMYRLICELGFPERVYSTLVRAAASSKTFETVTFHLPSTSQAKRVSFVSPTGSPNHASQRFTPQQKRVLSSASSPSPSPPRPEKAAMTTRFNKTVPTPQARNSNSVVRQVPPRNSSLPVPQPTAIAIPYSAFPGLEKSKRIQRFESSTVPVPIRNDADPLAAARSYLPPGDRDLSLLRLQPASKQLTAQLVATILRDALLPVESEAWYQFGFAATKDEAEERHLGGLYATILKEASTHRTAFNEVMEAVQTGGLVRLFDAKEYGHFRKAFPHLELFLSTLPAERPTIWRLKQFIRSDPQIEPPACLQRDYGFKLCRLREEVERMKVIYATMLRKIDPLIMHNHCIVGRLYEEGIVKTGIRMHSKDARLMKNDYPRPIGLDNNKGLEAYRGPFFKRTLKS